MDVSFRNKVSYLEGLSQTLFVPITKLMIICKSLQEIQKLISLVAAPVLVFECQSKKIVFCNDSAAELTGFDMQSISKISALELFDERSHSVVGAVLEILTENQKSINLREKDLKLRRKTGRILEISVSVSACMVDDKKYSIFTLEDVTEIKKQEKERKKLIEETARVSKLADIGRLTAGMAHELNNPLAILIGYLENLAANIRDGALEKDTLLEDIIPIEKASQRMSKVIGKMLSTMRNEKNVLRPMPLKKLVDDALSLFEGILASQGIQLSVAVDEDLWVQADGSSIEQIIMNIITNATNALDSQKDRQIRIRSTLSQGQVGLEIWNNGSPIPLEVQSKLFTPFFTTKGAGEGTGLGLYMSFHIMKVHQGELQFLSNDQGTEFTLRFPQIAKPVMKPAAHAPRVLIVDDDTFFRKLMCKKLEKLHFVCEEARGGDEAIRILSKAASEALVPFDMMMIDYQMPRMNGLALIAEIQKLNIDIPIVLISGSLSSAELQIAKKYKLFASIAKPIENSELQILAEKINQRMAVKKTAA